MIEENFKNIEDLNFLIKSFFKYIKDNVDISNKNNTPLSISSGAFGENLSCIITNSKGSGTQGGCSFDNSYGDEVKTINYALQSKDCKKCKMKNVPFRKTCFNCGNNSFKQKCDTRGGINTKSHFDNLTNLRHYTFFTISCIKNTRFKIEGFFLKKDNLFLNQVLTIQHAFKSKTKNLLPTSVEFMMSCPAKFFDCEVDIENEIEVKINLLLTDYNIEQVDRKINKKHFSKTKQYKYWVQNIKEQFYDPVDNPLNIEAIKGTQGKPRGKTVRKNLDCQME